MKKENCFVRVDTLTMSDERFFDSREKQLARTKRMSEK